MQLIFFLSFSWLLGKAKQNLEMAGGVIFPWVPPRRGPAQPCVACLEAGCKKVSLGDMELQSQAAQYGSCPAPCRYEPALQQLLLLSPCPRCAHLQTERNCLEAARSSAGRREGKKAAAPKGEGTDGDTHSRESLLEVSKSSSCSD